MHTFLSRLENQNIILRLIKADLKSNQLIANLNRSGAMIENYYTDLARIIMELMGFEREEITDELFSLYDSYVKEVEKLELNEFNKSINEASIFLYSLLLAEQRLRRQGLARV